MATPTDGPTGVEIVDKRNETTNTSAAAATSTHIATEDGTSEDSATEMNVDEKTAGREARPAKGDEGVDGIKAKPTAEVLDHAPTTTPGVDENNIVFWDGDDDPHNPYNWKSWVKVFNCVLISALTFVTPLASSMFAPGVPSLMREFKSDSKELAAFCVSVYILGFAAGPMLFAPLSELYGRTRIYHVCNLGFIGPLSWRWVFWILVIVSGVISSLFLVLARETYAPVLLQRKTDRLVKETGNIGLRFRLDAGLAPRALFARAILRPFKLLAFSPICAICNVFVGIAYGYLYIMFTSITPLFEQQYGFDSIHAGLAFLGLGVGSMVGVGYFSTASDSYMKKKAKEAGELAADEEEMARRPSVSAIKPEYRLPPLRAGAILLPAGLFIYGWTAQYKVHWIVPIIGTAIMGVGNLVIFMLYLVDTFTIYAASALAANSVVRSLLGAVLPLAGGPMYERLGLGWGNSLLAFIAVALIPVPWLFMRYGEYLRKRFAIENV
ncbi:hypothetical protein LLEC1_03050 [Akanthomyces lecanii]|uniref:Major facilitator superfamily (MFS) profile domain-containing protein n=1 Tax=Cordyceps confragosa TaxID=2714763 RepID=A0A179I367_CORDF|nr:hypothetical protein LLEC1_03050 [Akanthomyces lecanii]